ncbi:hypothetical protein H6S82_09970 [Planktothrix sp. FACHB-1355]|uniref:Uncharacterized protein n=1 Tax=Aerosakkonema funiforme FACHB-1375 TaxID=2949571 RepID=A0A926VJT7_9CYAN|nr:MULTISPECIES: hypothetical protein [Oscillatoriales]MBD2183764.1 hypothetical protein [Aerosakkonema funiforme FACHB-1375]MBD3559186.1 hypothetical protein [Planktothrix sp. FACHB-1355]
MTKNLYLGDAAIAQTASSILVVKKNRYFNKMRSLYSTPMQREKFPKLPKEY